MYKCTLIKLIYKDSKLKQNGCYVEKQIVLPFVPYSGLSIFVGDRPFSEKIVEIKYLLKENKFICEVEHDAPAFSNTYEGFKNSYLESGWTTNGDVDGA